MEAVTHFTMSVLEYRYSSEKERDNHIHQMMLEGFECSKQITKSEDFAKSRWYAKFVKVDGDILNNMDEILDVIDKGI